MAGPPKKADSNNLKSKVSPYIVCLVFIIGLVLGIKLPDIPGVASQVEQQMARRSVAQAQYTGSLNMTAGAVRSVYVHPNVYALMKASPIRPNRNYRPGGKVPVATSSLKRTQQLLSRYRVKGGAPRTPPCGSRMKEQVMRELRNIRSQLYKPPLSKRRQNWLSRWNSTKSQLKSLPRSFHVFKTTISDTQLDKYLELLYVFTSMLSVHNLLYFIYGSSLVGALRHKGPIPWQDHIEVMVSYYERDKIRALCECLKPKYALFDEEKGLKQNEASFISYWRFYSQLSPSGVHAVPWRWPYIKIHFYDVTANGGYLRHVPFVNGHQFAYDAVFPLQTRWFGYLKVKTPADDVRLARKFGLETCTSRKWDHQKEMKMVSFKSVDCDDLSHHLTMRSYD